MSTASKRSNTAVRKAVIYRALFDVDCNVLVAAADMTHLAKLEEALVF